MTHGASEQPLSDRPAPSAKGRRALLAAGATAALGAAGVVLARPADAAAGNSLVLGRTNTSGSANTTVNVASTGVGFTVHQTGTGNGIYGLADRGYGAVAYTKAANRFGLIAQNLAGATSAVPGGAVRAVGRYNCGVYADTLPSVKDVPAILAVGGPGDDPVNGSGVALQARGISYLDGDALNLRSWVGVLTGPSSLGYAPLASGEVPTHTHFGTLNLDTGGNGSVVLPASFTAAVGSAAAVNVSLTPFGAAMPDLHVATATASQFTVAGGPTGGGTVHWVVRAERSQVAIAAGAAGAHLKAAAVSSRTAHKATVRSGQVISPSAAPAAP